MQANLLLFTSKLQSHVAHSSYLIITHDSFNFNYERCRICFGFIADIPYSGAPLAVTVAVAVAFAFKGL
jgi:hypothetical protein